MKKRVLFAGAYGIENAGDDLPLIVMCDQLQKMHPNIDFEFRALSRHPNEWEESHYGVKMIQNIEHESREAARGKWFRGLNPGDDSDPICKLREEIKAADLLIFGAGNWLIDITLGILRGPITLLGLYIFLAKLYHKPVMLYGLSAGPLKTDWGRDLTRWIVENADVVTVRDLDSKKLLEELSLVPKKFHLLPDATLGAIWEERALQYKGFIESKHKNGNKNMNIAVGLRDLAVVLNKDQAQDGWKQLAGFMNSIKDRVSFTFIPQSTYQPDDDRLTAKKFVKLLKDDVECHVIEKRFDPRDLIGLYCQCDLTIAIRLHTAVFSAIAGTPIIALNYLPKVKGFMDSIGFSNFLIDINNIQQNELLKLYNNFLDNKDKLNHKLRAKIAEQKNKVLRYGVMASEILFKS